MALGFAATIDNAARFKKSRAVGAYLGLTSRRHQSGEMDYTGRISKFGDSLLRSLLYEAANSLLTIVRKSHPLKDWARRIRKRNMTARLERRPRSRDWGKKVSPQPSRCPEVLGILRVKVPAGVSTFLLL